MKKRSEKFEVQDGLTIKLILGLLLERYPETEPYIPYIHVAVNQDYVSMDFEPSDKDEIVFITPVSGGWYERDINGLLRTCS